MRIVSFDSCDKEKCKPANHQNGKAPEKRFRNAKWASEHMSHPNHRFCRFHAGSNLRKNTREVIRVQKASEITPRATKPGTWPGPEVNGTTCDENALTKGNSCKPGMISLWKSMAGVSAGELGLDGCTYFGSTDKLQGNKRGNNSMKNEMRNAQV